MIDLLDLVVHRIINLPESQKSHDMIILNAVIINKTLFVIT